MTEGNVTTVVNESGSVWGGTATLVEELSIGLESGDEAYLFGRLAGVGMTQARIFVLDAQLRMIRSYDADGNHMEDCGGPGPGPGELATALYFELGTSENGRVFAHAGNEIEVFSADCEHLDTYSIQERLTLGAPMTVSDEGIPYLSVPLVKEGHPSDWIYGMQAFGSDLPSSEPISQPTFEFERDAIELEHRLASGGVAISRTSPPYAPDLVWAMMPSEAVVGGVSSDSRFEIRHRDGHRIVVLNPWTPVRLSGDEADWYARRFLALLHGEGIIDPPSWEASELPGVKPAFDRFLPDRSERLWVLRSGEGERLQGCDERASASSDFRASPCWRDPTVVEVFGPNGRYLGRVDVPQEMRWSPPPYIRDDDVVATAEDDAGTIMVKRYRLVLPGER